MIAALPGRVKIWEDIRTVMSGHAAQDGRFARSPLERPLNRLGTGCDFRGNRSRIGGLRPTRLKSRAAAIGSSAVSAEGQARLSAVSDRGFLEYKELKKCDSWSTTPS